MSQAQYIIYLADDDDLEVLTTAFNDVDCIAEVQWYKTTASLMLQLNSLVDTALPDLIVLDHHMPPNVEGELVKWIRSHEKLDSIALVIYTTIVQESKKLTMLHDGVDCLMMKGNSLDEIKEHVAIFCSIIAEKKLVAAGMKKEKISGKK